jgi:1,4-dihydroxy-2-naphthoate polyprenyltransferase
MWYKFCRLIGLKSTQGRDRKVNRWVIGARIPTLPSSIVPVVVGSMLAWRHGCYSMEITAACLLVSIFLQIGVNYANDYSDGIRGTDADRVGPQRLVASGLASAYAVKMAAMLCFAIAAGIGAVVSILYAPVLLFVGACAIAAAWFYTGGPKPYGYNGFGELSVFVFFGLAAVLGTVYLQVKLFSGIDLAAAMATGLLSCAMLMINNIRDLQRDKKAGKKTLAVRIGDMPARLLFASFLIIPVLVIILSVQILKYAWMVLILIPFILYAIRPVIKGAQEKELIGVLRQTGLIQILFAVIFLIIVRLSG